MAMMGVIYTEAMLEILPRNAKLLQRVLEQQKDHDCFKRESLSWISCEFLHEGDFSDYVSHSSGISQIKL